MSSIAELLGDEISDFTKHVKVGDYLDYDYILNYWIVIDCKD